MARAPQSASRLPCLPVIVGTGLTGCAISRSLSRAGVRHLLVGPAASGPGTRLGESLNLEASLDISAYFPELKAAFFSKSEVVAHVGDNEVRCDLNMRRGRLSAAFYRLLGYREPPDAFLHIDREGFDAAVFDLVVNDRHCLHIDAMVSEVDFDAKSDRIRALLLDDDREIVPLAVFDATNHVRAVARHVGLKIEVLGSPQRAVYGHLHAIDKGCCEHDCWHATHIVRLDRAADGVDGLAWYIPLRGKISVGVAVDRSDEAGGESASERQQSPEERLGDRELLERVVSALERREIMPAGVFAAAAEVRAIPYYRHFLHDRAYGRNWMLAGGTFCLMWFAASAGISSGFTAANVAPNFLREPRRFGGAYESILRGLRAPHGVFEWLRRTDPGKCELAELERRADVLVSQSVLRLAESVALQPGFARRALAGVLGGAIRGERFDASGICVRARGKALQSAANAESRLQVLSSLLDVFAGLEPLSTTDSCLDEHVVVHIDRLRFSGRRAWLKWARHSRATWPFAELRFEIVRHRYDEEKDQLEVWIQARVRDRPGEQERRSQSERFVYRFEDGLIREVWTSRRNYTFLYGRRFATLPGFVAHVTRLVWWNLRRSAGDPRDDEVSVAQ